MRIDAMYTVIVLVTDRKLCVNIRLVEQSVSNRNELSLAIPLPYGPRTICSSYRPRTGLFGGLTARHLQHHLGARQGHQMRS